MKKSVRKNEEYRYHLYPHMAMKADDESYFCRAANAKLQGEYIFCQECPLFGGMEIDYRGGTYPECWYYDLEVGFLEHLTPQEQKDRISGLILAGLTEEFPDYLADDEKGRKYAIIEKAIQFAAFAHKGVYRKGTKIPYIVHPMEVMMLTAKMTKDNDVIAAAALHDVVEDTKFTIEDIKCMFGERIAGFVAMESEDKQENRSKEDSWRDRKAETLRRAGQEPVEAKIIMLADKLSNMRATYRDYKKIGDKIWERFNMKDPKEHAWYQYGIAKALVELKDFDTYQEYIFKLKSVFPEEYLQ